MLNLLNSHKSPMKLTKYFVSINVSKTSPKQSLHKVIGGIFACLVWFITIENICFLKFECLLVRVNDLLLQLIALPLFMGVPPFLPIMVTQWRGSKLLLKLFYFGRSLKGSWGSLAILWELLSYVFISFCIVSFSVLTI